jgi:hypothetical protein
MLSRSSSFRWILKFRISYISNYIGPVLAYGSRSLYLRVQGKEGAARRYGQRTCLMASVG